MAIGSAPAPATVGGARIKRSMAPAPGSLAPAAPAAPRIGPAPAPAPRPMYPPAQPQAQAPQAPRPMYPPAQPQAVNFQQRQAAAPPGGWAMQTMAQPQQIPQSAPLAPAQGQNGFQVGASAKQQRNADTALQQQQLLGDPDLARRLGIDPATYNALTRKELGLAQVGEYARQEKLAEGDLSSGLEALLSGRNNVGNDPASLMAMQIAMRRAQEGGQFSDDYLDQQRGLIRNRGAVAAQGAERSMAEDFARRGIQGPLAGLYQAQLGQQNALGVQGQLGEFEQQAAGAREEAERAALSQLQSYASSQDQQRSAFDQAMANAYLNNERSALDFSPMAVEPRNKKKKVGGKAEKLPK